MKCQYFFVAWPTITRVGDIQIKGARQKWLSSGKWPCDYLKIRQISKK